MQHFKNICCCLVTESCPTLCDPLDCSPPGSSVHCISQARILERVAISSFKGSSQPRARTHNSCIKNISIAWHKWIAALQLWSLTKSACRVLKKKKIQILLHTKKLIKLVWCDAYIQWGWRLAGREAYQGEDPRECNRCDYQQVTELDQPLNLSFYLAYVCS